MASNITATTTTSKPLVTTAKKPGPPVPPRPQHAPGAGLLKTPRQSVVRAASDDVIPTAVTPPSAAATAFGLSPTKLPSVDRPVQLSRPSLLAADPESVGRRTLVYESPLREKPGLTSHLPVMSSSEPKSVASSGSRPTLKLRKAPDAPKIKPSEPPIAAIPINNTKLVATSSESKFSASKFIANFTKKKQSPKKDLKENRLGCGSGIGINLNRHNSLYTPKTSSSPIEGMRESRHSLGKADIGNMSLTKPLPKPQPIPEPPIATIPPNSAKLPNAVLLRRSKTSMDSLALRVASNGGRTSASSNCMPNADVFSPGPRCGTSFLGGKTAEIKNNLKNAAERLLSEMRSNQSNAALIKNELPMIQNTTQSSDQERVTIVGSTASTSANCTRINIGSPVAPSKTSTMDNVLQQGADQKTTFHEILISEITAMRAKSNSVDNLQLCNLFPESDNNKKYLKRCDSLEEPRTENADADVDSTGDSAGDEDVETLNAAKGSSKTSARKRSSSGDSSDSSPYGTERSSRIRTSDWVEVGNNGKQVTLTSCQISLEDSGLEDEERLDDMSSSGVGDSWDSVKEAEREKRCRSDKRFISPSSDLPPLPKSLSGINKMLGSDSGLLSDVDLFQNGIDAPANTATTTAKNQLKGQTISNNNNTNTNSNSNSDKNESDDKSNEIEVNEADEEIKSTPTKTIGNTLDAQLAILRKEMYGLRQLDLSLLSQLWALNNSIREFRTMMQEQHGEEDEDEDMEEVLESSRAGQEQSKVCDRNSLSSEGDDEKGIVDAEVITTQPRLANRTPTTTRNSRSNNFTGSSLKPAANFAQQKPIAPRPPDPKPMPRMRSAPPPPPTQRKLFAPPRPT